MALSLFFTLNVSNTCCFSAIVAVKCEAMLSAICEASANFFMLFIVSL